MLEVYKFYTISHDRHSKKDVYFVLLNFILLDDRIFLKSFILYEPKDLDYLSFPVPPIVAGGLTGGVNPVTIGVTKTVLRISIC